MAGRSRADRRRDTAFHEAGHAVAACLHGYPFRLVTIEPRTASLGHVLFAKWSGEFHPDANNDRRTMRRVEVMVTTALAGNAAQWILTRRNDWVGAREDNAHAVRMASYMCGDDDEALALVAYLRARVRNQLALAPNWAAVKAVAEALLERRTLRGGEARRLVRVALDSDADEWPLAEDI